MKDRLTNQIIKGFELLNSNFGYTQAAILKKFKALGISVNTASFSNVLRRENVGVKTLKKVCEGMDKIIDSELGMKFDEKEYLTKDLSHDWQPIIISEGVEGEREVGFEYFEEGRWDLKDKVEFINQAEQEVIEVGVRLNTFCNYFINRRDSEFRDHITALLERGVNVKLYMLNPLSNEALFYFKDRSIVQEREANSIEVMKEVVEKLNIIIKEYQYLDLKGSFELHFYKHLPYNHFLIVDGGTRSGKMLVSHYLYGIRRANCPVVRITKNKSRTLFKRYWESFKLLSQDATLHKII